MTGLAACPSCENEVSAAAFDCPHCGHPIRKPRRGFFGKLFKLLFVAFNLIMALWLISYWVQLGELSGGLASEAERAGAAIGGTIATGMILVTWVIGDVILGLLTILTRPRK